MAKREGRTEKQLADREKRKDARKQEATELGCIVTVRFTTADAERIKKVADAAKRPASFVIREAMLASLSK